MTDFVPKFPNGPITLIASADVIGGRLVEVTGSETVGPAGADSQKVVGTAARDAEAGEKVLVYAPGPVHVLVAAADIVAGKRVAAAAGGKVSGTGTNKVGLALSSADEDEPVIVLINVDAIDSAAS